MFGADKLNINKERAFTMSKSSITSSSSVDNPSVANIPLNLPPELPKRADRNAAAVPRTDHAPPETPTEMANEPVPIVGDAHELANLFPMFGAVEFQALCDDIAKNGQLEDIIMKDGRIVDGRNRYAACKALGIEPRTVELRIDMLSSIIGNNVRRRNMSKQQLAIVGAKLSILSEERPELFAQNRAISLEEAGELLGVSRAYVQHANKVCTKAVPRVVALVESGKLPLNKAAQLADATDEQQHEAVNIIKMGGKCPTFKPGEERPKLPTLKIQLTLDLQKAMEHPMDSYERAEALTRLFKEISAEAFGKNSPRKEFLKGIVEECAEYGVVPSVVSDPEDDLENNTNAVSYKPH